MEWLDPSELDALSSPMTLHDVTCPVCLGVLDAPLALACGHITCATCLHQCINYSVERACCPCCTRAITHREVINQPPNVLQASINSLRIRCRKPYCTAIVTLQQLPEHYASCQPPPTQLPTAPQTSLVAFSSPSATSLRRVLDAPLDKTPSLAEQRAATHIIRRMVNSSCESANAQDLRLPTGGRVSTIKNVQTI